MKKIVLFFLALTLVVMSCSADDTTGAGESGGPGAGANTPAGRSWASKVGGKTFTDSNGDKIEFTSNGIPPNHRGEEEDVSVTYSMPKAISENRVVIKAYVKYVEDGEVGEYTEYTGYELDDSEALILTSSYYDNLADVKFENMTIDLFNPSKLNPLKTRDWFNGVDAGSIFMSKEFKVKRGWGERDANADHTKTNEVSTFGYLRIGDLGRMDGGVHYNRKQDDTYEPINSIESDVLNSAKNGTIAADSENGTDGYYSNKLDIAGSYSYISGNNRIYVLGFDGESTYEGKTDNYTNYNIYNLEYDSDAKDTIKFISSSYDLKEMPKSTVLKFKGKIN